MATQQKTFFKDLSVSFNVNPITKDISFVKNDGAVKKALLNLLRTPRGTRPFRPDYGVDLQKYLFEPTDYDTEVSINRDIAEAIQKFEPRVQLISIESVANEETNSIDVTIEYFVVGVPQQQTLQTSITTRVK